MFEFLFKRPGDKPSDQQANPEQAAASAATAANAEQTAARRAAQLERAKALGGDETGAVDLILQSEFADVRLAAAEHVNSQAMLEKVQQAMRNTDRRVAKLMQGRLDALRHQQAEQRQAEAAIASARKLAQDDKLTPNLVAELDRMWKVIAAGPALTEEFDAVRATLAKRLEDQMALQRAALDALAAVRRIAAGQLPEGVTADAVPALLDELAAGHAARQASPEKESLPRHLLADFDTALAGVRAGQETVAARRAALAGWQAQDAATLNADELKRSWNALPKVADAVAAQALQQEFDALLAAVPAPVRVKEEAPPPKVQHQEHGGKPEARKESPAAQEANREANRHFMAIVDQMEAALNQGQLHIAADHDKVLKETRTGRLTQAQADRLAHVRAELKRLGDWARWGGNVSREELVKAVEELPAQKLSMPELAKKVGSMRERWKALDGVSGAAPKSLWERFDAACTAAYAPAAAHFKHLADERHTNAAKAEAMISEVEKMAAELAGEVPNFKALAAAAQRLRQAWGRLGAIDRKEKKKLDAAFDQAMAKMTGPLEEQRRIEVARREQLIAETEKLAPTDRHTLDTVRHLQEQWQEYARALPLERKQEQALWQRFRAACDAIFAARKESAHAADSERKAHLHVREDICAQLENATFTGDDKAQLAAITKALRDAAQAWHASGHVPRASEGKIEARYKAATAAVQAQADAIRKRAGAAQANALRDKLRLTQALESAITTGETIDGADWESRWKALPALPGEYERVLHGRFAAGIAAAAESGKRSAYAARLEQARATLLSEVLRLEIVAGVDSGAEFARDRLKMQVEVLQSSLKSGQKPMTQAAQFLQLCAMPALADARTASRIEQLFRRIGADAK
ncbi:hypothetical protein GCM10027277_37590 [Pseudoduganella ginsengisoli]|uniref:DUF349 domain-containing protein n=1 Tax=Pseudoduganella ginsengisoli TaxID=1462440 RepID=A0A6L6PZE5_9BURK|nr:DUF349 domain-containing protein [Pseudoduganella ginsengisoli]MTW02378.1 DUF349 domain-containing protein [Pseudoduganella ginsengisoli]